MRKIGQREANLVHEIQVGEEYIDALQRDVTYTDTKANLARELDQEEQWRDWADVRAMKASIAAHEGQIAREKERLEVLRNELRALQPTAQQIAQAQVEANRLVERAAAVVQRRRAALEQIVRFLEPVAAATLEADDADTAYRDLRSALDNLDARFGVTADLPLDGSNAAHITALGLALADLPNGVRAPVRRELQSLVRRDEESETLSAR
jgi:hypothetical protein